MHNSKEITIKKPVQTTDKLYQMHVISNTHWDREWRNSFQHTRMALVDTMDQLLEIMENDPDYKHYHLDSQTIMIEDYLQVRPENKKRLENLINTGRILAGPWYSNPDMNCISGESIIRNLLLGHKIARSLGGVMKVGYNPFSFGQVSQLPQIYAEFGMDTILFYRGVGRHRVKSEFWWEGADGTRALASQLSSRSRYNFYYHVYQRVCEGITSDNRKVCWGDIPLPARICSREFSGQSVYALKHLSKYNPGLIADGMEQLLAEDENEFTTEHFLLMQGCDTTAPNPMEPRLISDCDKYFKKGTVFHSSLPEYVASLKKSVTDLSTLHGEMREPMQTTGVPCLGDVISARTYLKQANAQASIKLERLAEPLTVIASLFGPDDYSPFLEIAWKYLLANHAHDSISGCAVDQVHEDMMYRFDQCQQISDELIRRCVMKIASVINGPQLSADSSLITVFNSLPFERSRIAEVFVDIDQDIKTSLVEIFDHQGHKIEIQQLGCESDENTVQFRTDWPQIYNSKKLHLLMAASNIPALGYNSFVVRPKPGNMHCAQSSLIISPREIENEFVFVQINSDGTFNVKNKQTEAVFNNLGYFEDCGECGHAWIRSSPINDQVITSIGSPAKVSIFEKGPLRSSFKIERILQVPAQGDNQTRSSDLVNMPITMLVTLEKCSPYVTVDIELTNTARDHRLRVCFPSGLKATETAAESAFDIVTRPIQKIDRTGWRENSGYTSPKLGFVDITDGQNGLAVICEGLCEYEALTDKDKTLAITLLRSIKGRRPGFGFPPFVKEGPQCLGKFTCRYAIYPHKGSWSQASVFEVSRNFSTPFISLQSGSPSGVLPMQTSFFKVLPAQLVFSGMKKSEARNSVIVRLFNPTDAHVSGILESMFKIEHAWVVNCEELRLNELVIKNPSCIEFEVGPKKIFTLEFETAYNDVRK